MEYGFDSPEEWFVGFDRQTGNVVTIDDGTMQLASDAEDQGLTLEEVETDSEIIAEMLPLAWAVVTDFANARFVRLPTKWDFHEYRRMEEFIESLPEGRAQGRLWRAVGRKGAFRRFKDEAHRLDVIDDWYAFRQNALRQLLQRWAQDNAIEIADS
ncbi:MAG: hypothetical protein SynsKO_34550 [Synoicihabitans sp.]